MTETTKDSLDSAGAEQLAPDDGFQEPGVLVWREALPNGDARIQISTLNGFDPFAVQTLLQLAIKYNKEALGV